MENRVFYTFTDENDGNLAFHVEDNEINVIKNRKNLALKLGYNYEDLVYMNQIHSANIIVVDENSPKLVDNCDSIITRSKNLPLMVMVADCIPILMFDDKKGIIAAIHAGRNSTFLEISKKTAEVFIEKFSSNPENLNARRGAVGEYNSNSESIYRNAIRLEESMGTLSKGNSLLKYGLYGVAGMVALGFACTDR
jgi:YfiH family protein